MGSKQETQGVQRYIPCKGRKQKAEEARLHLRIKQMEVNDAKCKSEMGHINTPFRSKIRPWDAERQMALESEENRTEKTARLYLNEQSIMTEIRQRPVNQITAKTRDVAVAQVQTTSVTRKTK